MRSKTVKKSSKKSSKKLSKKSSKKSTKTTFKCVNCGLTFKTKLGLDAHKLLFGKNCIPDYNNNNSNNWRFIHEKNPHN